MQSDTCTCLGTAVAEGPKPNLQHNGCGWFPTLSNLHVNVAAGYPGAEWLGQEHKALRELKQASSWDVLGSPLVKQTNGTEGRTAVTLCFGRKSCVCQEVNCKV